MNQSKLKTILINLAFVCASLVILPAHASDLASAKAAGHVGEAVTGYVAVRGGGATAQQVAATINAKRKARYQQIASQNGISLADVEKLAGQKAIDKTPAGQWVQDAGGSWRRK